MKSMFPDHPVATTGLRRYIASARMLAKLGEIVRSLGCVSGLDQKRHGCGASEGAAERLDRGERVLSLNGAQKVENAQEDEAITRNAKRLEGHSVDGFNSDAVRN